MFSNCFQSPLFEVYNSKDAKNSNGNKEKLKYYSKLIDVNSSVYEYDPILKTYILNTKQLKLPYGKDQELSLVHPIIGIQGRFKDSIHLELFIVDTKSTRRRIILNSLKKGECKPFFVSMPITQQSAYNNWVTILIDIPSFLEAFKGSSYRSLESILIQSQCQIRRVFMMQSYNECLLGQYHFPLEANGRLLMIKYLIESELFIEQKTFQQEFKKEVLKEVIKKQKEKQNPKIQDISKAEINCPHPQQISQLQQIKKSINPVISKLKKQVQQKSNQQLVAEKENVDNEFIMTQMDSNHLNTAEDLTNINDLINIIESENNVLEKRLNNQRVKDEQYQDNLIDIIDAINQAEQKKPKQKQEFIMKNPIGCTTITKQGNNTVVIENRREQDNFVKLIFDPILNCYFDPENNKCFV